MATPAPTAPEATAAPTATTAEAAPTPVLDWLKQYRNVAFGALAVVVLAGVGWLYYTTAYLPERNIEAWDQMSAAVRYFEKDSLDRALRGSANNPGFETIADEYGDTKAGNLARLYRGFILLKQEKWADAAEALESYDIGKNMVGVSAHAALGRAYEGQGEHAKAAAQFEKAALLVLNSQTTPEWLLQAGQAYERAGDTAAALRTYRRLAADYPTTNEGQQVEKFIARLSPDTAE